MTRELIRDPCSADEGEFIIKGTVSIVRASPVPLFLFEQPSPSGRSPKREL